MNKMLESDIESLLVLCQSGDKQARNQLFDLLYPELKRITYYKLNNQFGKVTIQATEIVHELYIKLNKAHVFPAKSKLYFTSIAAIVIEQIIIDYCRSKSRLKRGGDLDRVELSEYMLLAEDTSKIELMDLTECLCQLEKVNTMTASVTRLKLFAGMGTLEIAEVMNISTRTVERKWTFSKTYMRHNLQQD